MKKNILVENLCKNLGDNYMKFFFYIKSLRYTDEPDYNFLLKLFQDDEIKNIDEYKFEWNSIFTKTKDNNLITVNNEIKNVKINIQIQI
jgi:casein kinase 1